MVNQMNKLKEMREKTGLSQQSFAERLGIGITSLSRWERGIGKPSRLAIMAINRAADELGLARPFDGPPLPKALGITWKRRRKDV